MALPFSAPGIDRLAEVDRAECEYTTECVEIQGVVSPSSQGGWPATEDFSVHCFSFSAWRRVGGPLRHRELTILRPVAPKANWFSAFSAYTIHRIKALLSTDETRAIFASESKLDGDDAELLAVAEELRRPVVISTSRFGDLILDRRIGWFEGEVDWNGERIRAFFHTDDDNDITAGLKTAEVLWESQAEWKRMVDDFAVQELLPVKNDYWLDEDEGPLNADQFKARMRIESISISSDGSLEFCHDDGDLFSGHSIEVSGSLKDGLTHADIPG